MVKKIGLMLLISSFLVSCNFVGKTFSKVSSKLSKEVTEEIAEDGGKKIVKEVSDDASGRFVKKAVSEGVEDGAKIIVRKEGREMMEYLTKNNPAAKNLIEKVISERGLENADRFVVNVSDDGMYYLSHLDWSNTKIAMKGNTCYGKAGCVASAENQAMNEFLNHRLPNIKYTIDDNIAIQSDNLARLSESHAILCKDNIISRSGRDINVERRVKLEQDGIMAVDHGGHSVQNALGGPNEFVNQVPMHQSVNNGGIWKSVEGLERKLVDEGKTILSTRNYHYHGKSKRPYEVVVDVICDGKHAEIMVDGKLMKCPITIPNPM